MSIFDRLKALLGGRARNGASTPPVGETDEVEMIPCEEALRLVHEFLDGELEGVPETQVREHFDVCQRCYPHLHLETAFREAIRRAASDQSAPADLHAKVSSLLDEARTDG